jgi:hypothetical protein
MMILDKIIFCILVILQFNIFFIKLIDITYVVPFVAGTGSLSVPKVHLVI